MATTKRVQGAYRAVLDVVKSSSNPDRTYEIRLGADDRVYCTCIGWRYHHHCKHLAEFREARSRRAA
jgi:hypothetical protein